MIVLTPPMAGDLRYLVALFRLSVGLAMTHRQVVGDSIRTGRALAARGLVTRAPEQFVNRVATWIPTPAGLFYVESNFVPFDDCAMEAVTRASVTMRAQRGPRTWS